LRGSSVQFAASAGGSAGALQAAPGGAGMARCSAGPALAAVVDFVAWVLRVFPVSIFVALLGDAVWGRLACSFEFWASSECLAVTLFHGILLARARGLRD